MQITITTTGLDSLQLKLDRYHGPKLDKALGKATLLAARTLVKPMRAAAPVAKRDHTGKYARPKGGHRKSIKAIRNWKRDKPGASVGPRVWSRHFPIGGVRGGQGNDYVTRTAAAHSGTTERKFRDVLHAELTKR